MTHWAAEIPIPHFERRAAARRPVIFWPVALAVCLLPLEWWLLPYSLKIVDFALVALVAAGSLHLLLHRRPVRLPLLLPVWLILIASLLATVSSIAFTDSVLVVVQEVYLYVWFVLLANLLLHLLGRDFDALLKLWSAVALFEAAAAVMGMLHIGPAMFHTNPNGNVVLSGGEVDRALGTFANPNAAGTYLFISLFVLLAAGWPRWFTAPATVWLLGGIFATGSMGALLTALASLAALLIVTQGQHFRPALGVLAVAGAVVLGLGILLAARSVSAGGMSLSDSDLFLTTFGRFPRSLVSRLGLIERLWPAYLQYPLGIGPNVSAAYMGSLHNDYVAFLIERGPLGLIGWLWVMGAMLTLPLRALRRRPDRPGNDRWVVLALGAALLAVSLNALTHELAHFRQVWMLMAFLTAASWRTRTPA
ncbi:MAG TPA: O-antigen ligase family protein [Anaerolineaceae bacterium]|nr:O-antigen ligase family protein [Anaerolineaceae bacterium]